MKTLAGRRDTRRGELASRRTGWVAPGSGTREIIRLALALAGFAAWALLTLLVGGGA